MEALLNQVLQAESTEQLGASNYERSQERSDFINACGTRTYIYNYFDIGSTNSGTYSTPKNSLSPK